MTEDQVYEVLRFYANRWRASGLDPEDLAHDAYLKYRAQRYEVVPGKSYLYTILSTLALDHLRHRQMANRRLRHPRSLDQRLHPSDVEVYGEQVGGEDPELDALEWRVELDQLWAHVAGDPRVLLLLPPLGYLTDEDLVERFGGTVQMYRALRYKARQTLRGNRVTPRPVRNQLILRIARELTNGQAGTVPLRWDNPPQGARQQPRALSGMPGEAPE